jgi:hypothetical protein
LALRRASFSNIVTTFRPAPRRETTKSDIEEYIQEARDFVHRYQDHLRLEPDEREARLKQLCIPDKLFVDYAYVYHDRLANFESFWLLDNGTAYEALSKGLSKTFNLIFSKEFHGCDNNRDTLFCGNFCSLFIWLFNLVLPIVPIVLIHASDNKQAYKGSDIKVTFSLLYILFGVFVFQHVAVFLHRLVRRDCPT